MTQLLYLKHFILLTVLALSFQTALVAQTPAIHSTLSETELHQAIHTLLQKYREVPMARDSPDFSLFETVGKAAQANPAFLDKLIDLTAIQEVRPDTTELLSAMRLSPAGRELYKIGDGARAAIQVRLGRGDLTMVQRSVLDEVIHFLDLQAANSSQDTAPVEASGRQNVTAQPSNSLLTPNLPSSKTPPAQEKAAEAKPTPHATSKEPNSSTPWSIMIGVGLAALGLLWLLLKRVNFTSQP